MGKCLQGGSAELGKGEKKHIKVSTDWMKHWIRYQPKNVSLAQVSSQEKFGKRIRICYPKVCYFNQIIILSLRQLRSSRHRKAIYPIPLHLKAKQKHSFVEVVASFSLPHQEENDLLTCISIAHFPEITLIFH